MTDFFWGQILNESLETHKKLLAIIFDFWLQLYQEFWQESPQKITQFCTIFISCNKKKNLIKIIAKTRTYTAYYNNPSHISNNWSQPPLTMQTYTTRKKKKILSALIQIKENMIKYCGKKYLNAEQKLHFINIMHSINLLSSFSFLYSVIFLPLSNFPFLFWNKSIHPWNLQPSSDLVKIDF